MLPVRSKKATAYQPYVIVQGPDISGLIELPARSLRTDTTDGRLLRYVDLPRRGNVITNLYQDVEARVLAAVSVTWGFYIDQWAQPLRINEYPPGKGFPFHIDHTASDMSKVAAVTLLPGDFTGGRLWLYDNDWMLVDLVPGEMVVFPAYHPHRVDPILKGTRRTLAAWFTSENRFQ